jgi:hypothetical protein
MICEYLVADKEDEHNYVRRTKLSEANGASKRRDNALERILMCVLSNFQKSTSVLLYDSG